MSSGATVALSVKTNLSYGHLQGAALLAGQCAKYEQTYSWPATDEVLVAHGSSAIGSVVLAACSLESWANEYHHDIVDGNKDTIGSAYPVAKTVADLWDTVERQPLLRKYQWFLQVSRCEPLEEGSTPFQAAADLIELRDALVHFKPEWSHSARQNRRLENRLRGKFQPNRLSMPDQLYIPYRCLGHGSGVWAVETVLAFAGAFCRRSGRENLYSAYSDRLRAALNPAAA